MIGLSGLTVVMVMLVVAIAGTGAGPRTPGMRKLSPLAKKNRPLLSLRHLFDGVGAYARTPFCFRFVFVASGYELCYHSPRIRMKYKTLLQILKVLIYSKRFLWRLGSLLSLVLSGLLLRAWHVKGHISYRLSYRLKKLGFAFGREWYTKRLVVHGLMILMLGVLALPQSRWWKVPDFGVPGQQTRLYPLVADTSDVETYEEVTAAPSFAASEAAVPWDAGALAPAPVNLSAETDPGYDVLADTLSGLAILKPIAMPGAIVSGRIASTKYEVEPGDSFYSIAADFGVSIATIIWANNLTPNSILRPGNVLVIPPVTGVLHTVRRGDTVSRIAALYKASADEIIAFNRLGQNGEGLKAGEEVVVPNGTKQAQAPSIATKTPSPTAVVRRGAVPAASREAAGATGFIWPTGARVVTQGFGIRHHALDIAGPFHTPNYAANAGKVITANCPPPGEYRGAKLNHGYGCWIIIDHGNGIQTLYGHNDQILVSVGDFVERGQTIGLMGNTGNVRGVTGIHLHFEVILRGQRVNPYGYVR